MATDRSKVIQRLREAVLLRDGGERTDGQLLECFVSRGEGAALEALVHRHAPMVWGVCRRLLPHHEAEDAFQTTFLVLVRKAGSVLPREMVGNWLYGVAHRTALKARATAAKQQTREKQVTALPERGVEPQEPSRDLQLVLDQELSRLPDKYRAAIVLCDLEDKTRTEAARQLGVPEGTLAARVARARKLLAKRLARHGLAVPAGTFAGGLSQQAARGSVSPSVLSSTMKVVSVVGAGQALPAGLISAKVAALAEGVMRGMMLTKIKSVVLVAVSALCLCGITGAVVGLAQDGKEAGKKPAGEGQPEGKQAAKPAGDAKAAEDMKANLEARVALAEKCYEAAFENLKRTKRFGNVLLPQANPEDAYTWSVRWLQSERDRSPKRADQIAALEAHLERMQNLEKALEPLSRDLLPRSAALGAEWYLREAELWLAQAQAK